MLFNDLLSRRVFTYSASPECSAVNTVFDPVILKVNANPDPADIVGYKCYISHKQALGGVAKSSVSEPSAQSAADSLSEVADLCQC